MGDGDYLYAFQQVVMPIAQEFNPDLVIVSAGFDAAEGDALGMCHVSPAGFAHMTHMLMSLAGGKIVACLEGGYNLRSIARSSLAVTRTLMGEPPDRIDPEHTEPSANGVATVQLVIGEQSKYWKCLYPKETYETRLHRMGGERLSDVLRNKQASDYWSKFRMSPLYILREKISKSFENQVLAT
jgi:histone deacetylase 6